VEARFVIFAEVSRKQEDLGRRRVVVSLHQASNALYVVNTSSVCYTLWHCYDCRTDAAGDIRVSRGRPGRVPEMVGAGRRIRSWSNDAAEEAGPFSCESRHSQQHTPVQHT
jgi:hypothetical protein